MARTPSKSADSAESPVGLMAALTAASRSAAQAGQHAEHAALEVLLTSTHVLKTNALRALEMLEGDLAEQIKTITDKL
ncbi:hypothetical protein [Herbaspirillum frisingense]|uniref:hypothetical protein n=1 Tax=Herbaspirillum frisingense TaxID=92645 RepID=UPI0039B03541